MNIPKTPKYFTWGAAACAAAWALSTHANIIGAATQNADGSYTYSYIVDNTAGATAIRSWSLDISVAPDWNSLDTGRGGSVTTPNGWLAGGSVSPGGFVEDFSRLQDGFYGDVDQNGTIDLADVRLMLRQAVGENAITGEALLKADMDHDGIVGLPDVRRDIRTILGIVAQEPFYFAEPVLPGQMLGTFSFTSDFPPGPAKFIESRTARDLSGATIGPTAGNEEAVPDDGATLTLLGLASSAMLFRMRTSPV